MLEVLLATATFGVIYFLSSGAAFVMTYRWPSSERAKLFSQLFRPLEVLGKQWPWFSRTYTGLHNWCYRTFARGAS
jgi:hypothetical protein